MCGITAKSTTTKRILCTGCLAALYFAVFARIGHFTDTAEFGGDIWEYQSMAVNFAKGHGIARFGGVEDFGTYTFEVSPDVLLTRGVVAASREPFLHAGRNGGVESFYRTPGYHLFLGILYKLFGISPLIAKHVQLLLLCIVAAVLPWIGLRSWGRLGWVSGLIASPITIASNYRFSEFLYTESLITFAVFSIVAAYVLLEEWRTLPCAMFLGFMLGMGLLMKASLLFILPLLSLSLLWRWCRTRRRSDLLHLFAVVVVCALTVAPWSIYASARSGALVLLSTQTEAILLDAHNEYVKGGVWWQKWRDDPQSFYNNDGLAGRSAWLRVANFYRHHPSLLPRLAAEKLLEGFRSFPLLLVGVWLLIGEYFVLIWRSVRRLPMRNPVYIPPIFVIVFVNFVLMTLLTHVDHVVYQSRIVKPMEFLFILFGMHRILLVLCAALRPFFGRIGTLLSARFAR